MIGLRMRISHGRETAKVRITMSMNSLSEEYVHTVGVLDVKMVSFKDCTTNNCGLFTAAL